jgi:hypothetical protein
MKRFNEFRLYEFEERQKMPTPEQISFMDKLYNIIKKELVPNIPKEFKIDYDRGREIIIHTDNKKDLRVGAKISDEKMIIFSKPIGEPEFEINFNFQNANIDNVIHTIKSEFEKSETNGISTGLEPREFKSFRDDDDDDDDNIENNQEYIDTPITEKPKRIKRSIDIKIIKNILEDAFILDDIELKQVTIDELIRRMLLESRKNR